MDFCKYKNALGVPGEGIHSYRLFDIAIFDVIGTLIIAALISIWFDFSYFKTFSLLMLLALFLHKLFCVETTLTKALSF